MKKYYFIVLISLLMLHNASGKLRNGYEIRIGYVRESLNNYYHILTTNKNLPASEKRKIKARMQELIIYQVYYELTENLLSQFKTISPVIFNQIDSIKDAKGRHTDVYVQFISREEGLVMPAGKTYMAQSNEDDDICFSEYGKHTVAVKVWVFSKALFVLAHEFGHVDYQVPNLAGYTEYYKNVYPILATESNYVGHECNDSSGKNAIVFETMFRKDYMNFLKFRDRSEALGSPLALIQEIRKRVELELFGQLADDNSINLQSSPIGSTL
jgi:hypothetical protein